MEGPKDHRMARLFKKAWSHGFKLYFAFCLLSFTLLILLINVTRVFAAESLAALPSAPPEEITAASEPSTPLRNFYRWDLTPNNPAAFQETYVEFRGNKMFLKVRF
jgi:hypothetical protein